MDGLSNILIRALLSETRTIPIVAWSGDPIAAGFVSSLARPGGNVTGVSADAGAEINGKRVALLAEAVGKLDNIGALTTPAIWQTSNYDPMRDAAQKMESRCDSSRYKAQLMKLSTGELLKR